MSLAPELANLQLWREIGLEDAIRKLVDVGLTQTQIELLVDEIFEMIDEEKAPE